ncbi:MAG: TetR/AcrR family transcriptional regulator [Deltaproteobacteria bacterium]|nr:TetR/AcrR family transcriptional regulator [Deltaproteobacteria bacterium]
MANVRTPKQDRGIATRNRIMKAGFALFAQNGIHGTNSKQIVERAGVSIGTFYSYFRNKKKLLVEILDDFLDRVFLTIWKGMEGHAVNALGRDEIRLIIENVFKAYEIAPAFLGQTHVLRYSDPEIKRCYDRERDREVTQIRYLLDSNKNRMRVRDPFAAAVVIHNAVESVAHTAMFLGPPVDKNLLMDELADMIFSYLL